MRPHDLTVAIWIFIAVVALLLLLRLLLRAADLMNDWRQRRGVRVRRAQIGIGGAARTNHSTSSGRSRTIVVHEGLAVAEHNIVEDGEILQGYRVDLHQQDVPTWPRWMRAPPADVLETSTSRSVRSRTAPLPAGWPPDMSAQQGPDPMPRTSTSTAALDRARAARDRDRGRTLVLPASSSDNDVLEVSSSASSSTPSSPQPDDDYPGFSGSLRAYEEDPLAGVELTAARPEDMMV